MKHKKLPLVILAALSVMSVHGAGAAELTADAPTFAQDFNSMWSDGSPTLALPDGWRVDRNLTAPRVVGKWADASAQVMYTGAASLAAKASNGTYNFGSSSDETDRAVGGLTTTVSNGTRGVNVMTCLHNADPALIIDNLTIGYAVEKYRNGANAAGFAVQLYTSADGEAWTSAGDDFYTYIAPDSETIGAEVVPISTTAVDGRSLRVRLTPGSDLYLAWNISVASGETPDKAPGLALDDVTVTATFTDTDPIEATELILSPASVILVPEVPAQVRVLSLNNSLIHYNDQSAMFNDIAGAMGKDAEWTKHTLLGKSLATHWNEGDGLASDGLPGAKMMVRSQPWSHIILQEQSSLPRTKPETFRENVGRWVEYIRANCPNPNAVIILPVNWAYSGDWNNFTDYNKAFMDVYGDIAAEFGVTVCPVAAAYQSVYETEGTVGIAPWFQDDRHPTDMSTYMAACMEYGLIYGTNPAEITYAPKSVAEADAAKMRRYASEALAGYVNAVDQHAATVRYRVRVIDNFGNDMTPGQLSFSTDGGSIDSDGVFTATEPGEYHVTVTDGTFTGRSTVTVTSAVTEMPVIPAIKLSADALSYTQDFDAMGDAANAALPEGWRIERRTDAPRVVGKFRDAVEQTMYSGGVSLPSNAKNGLWNFGDNAGTDRAVGGITTGVDNGTRGVNVYAHFVNDGLKALQDMTLSYAVEKYRDGNNAAGFTVALYTSVDGNIWTPASDEFVTNFDPSASTVGFETVPGETVHVSATLPGTLGAGCDLYLAWNISPTSGSNCAGAPALAIDDVELTATLPAVPAYDWHIYVEDKTGYEAMGAYAWGDAEIWGAWPGQSPIDIREIDGCVYKIFGHNLADGGYNLILNNWNRGSQLPDFRIEGGRDYWLTATSSGVSVKDVDGLTDAVTAVSGPARWIDLRGVEVANPQAGHFYIRLTSEGAVKTIYTGH